MLKLLLFTLLALPLTGVDRDFRDGRYADCRYYGQFVRPVRGFAE